MSPQAPDLDTAVGKLRVVLFNYSCGGCRKNAPYPLITHIYTDPWFLAATPQNMSHVLPRPWPPWIQVTTRTKVQELTNQKKPLIYRSQNPSNGVQRQERPHPSSQPPGELVTTEELLNITYTIRSKSVIMLMLKRSWSRHWSNNWYIWSCCKTIEASSQFHVYSLWVNVCLA